MTAVTKREFPSQTENRKQWILDSVRANQRAVSDVLFNVFVHEYGIAADVLSKMHKQDRDALLQPNGILTSSQIEELTTTGQDHRR
jgi:hypothetical protein